MENTETSRSANDRLSAVQGRVQQWDEELSTIANEHQALVAGLNEISGKNVVTQEDLVAEANLRRQAERKAADYKSASNSRAQAERLVMEAQRELRVIQLRELEASNRADEESFYTIAEECGSRLLSLQRQLRERTQEALDLRKQLQDPSLQRNVLYSQSRLSAARPGNAVEALSFAAEAFEDRAAVIRQREKDRRELESARARQMREWERPGPSHASVGVTEAQRESARRWNENIARRAIHGHSEQSPEKSTRNPVGDDAFSS